jgi:hypothetical protein
MFNLNGTTAFSLLVGRISDSLLESPFFLVREGGLVTCRPDCFSVSPTVAPDLMSFIVCFGFGGGVFAAGRRLLPVSICPTAEAVSASAVQRARPIANTPTSTRELRLTIIRQPESRT